MSEEKNSLICEKTTTAPSKQEERKVFKCSTCGLFSRYEYFGTKPLERHSQQKQSQSSQQTQKKENIILLEKSYVSDDPFSELKSANYLVLGSNCNVCNQMVCVSNECSFFYFKRRFCFKCATQYMDEFPLEIKTEINKFKEKNSNK